MGGRISVDTMAVEDLRRVYLLGQRILPKTAVPCRPSWGSAELAEVYSEFPELCLIARRKNQFLGFLIGSVAEDGEGPAGMMLWWGSDPRFAHLPVMRHLWEEFRKRVAQKDLRRIMALPAVLEGREMDFFLENDFTEKNPCRIMIHFTEG